MPDITDLIERLEKATLGLELIEVDLTAGDLTPKTRVKLALHRTRAVLAALKARQVAS